MPDCIDAGEPAVMISHWQGFYGMHDDDRRGYNTFKTVVRRLKERDPHSEKSRWRKCSEITNYACAAELSTMSVDGSTITLDLPVQVPEFTLRLTDTNVKGVRVNGKPLGQASIRRDFRDGTWFTENGATYAAFTPTQQKTTVAVS